MWTSAPGGDRPSRDQIVRWQRRQSPPANEVAVAASVPTLVARTDAVAVAITGARTYSTGVSFDLAVRVRSVPSGLRTRDLHPALSGHGRPEEGGPDLRLLLGVEFADGRTGSNLGGSFAGLEDADPDRPQLRVNGSSGSGGSGRSFHLDGGCWLTPLPPDGPVTFVVAWPAFDLAETRKAMPDATFTSDSARVVVLWPEPDDTERDRPAPPPPAVPPGSWFAGR